MEFCLESIHFLITTQERRSQRKKILPKVYVRTWFSLKVGIRSVFLECIHCLILIFDTGKSGVFQNKTSIFRRIPTSRASSAAGSEVGNTSAPSSWKLAGDSYTSRAKPKMFGREKPCRSRFSASYLNPTTLGCKYQKYTYIVTSKSFLTPNFISKKTSWSLHVPKVLNFLLLALPFSWKIHVLLQTIQTSSDQTSHDLGLFFKRSNKNHRSVNVCSGCQWSFRV